ncbi:MAG: carbohydrate kinase family protein [Anaerolineales bacterium]|nr:carbohydrate kinase family protein [Anaerolineales bacterium]
MKSPSPIDVAVIGNVGIDTNIYFYGAEIDFQVETNFTENRDYIGQAGGYACRGYARLNKRTAFIGYVGDDFSGNFIRNEFARDGIDTTALFIDPAGTSRSINFMYPDGRRKNFYDGKSHMHLQPDLDICRAILAQSRLAHFNLPNWARLLLPVARELGVIVACDLQDVTRVDDPYRQDFIQAADFLFFSAANYPDPTPLIQAFLRKKSDLIILTGMGAQGCALGTHSGIQFYPPETLDEPVIDTNGAGDALAVGFLTSYLLDGYSLADSVRRGQIAARYTCTLKADSTNLITRQQLDHYSAQ